MERGGRRAKSQKSLQYWIHTLCSRRVGCATCRRSNSIERGYKHRCSLPAAAIVVVCSCVVVVVIVGCPFAQEQQQQHDVAHSPPSYYIVFLDQTSLHCCMCHVPCLVWSSRVSSVLSLLFPLFPAPVPVLCCCAIINNHNSNLLPLYCSLNPVYDVAFVSFLAAKKFWFDRDPLDKYNLGMAASLTSFIWNVHEMALSWFKRKVLKKVREYLGIFSGF